MVKTLEVKLQTISLRGTGIPLKHIPINYAGSVDTPLEKGSFHQIINSIHYWNFNSMVQKPTPAFNPGCMHLIFYLVTMFSILTPCVQV